jgi:threonine/homoserine efflux transporter RhtA
LSLNPSLSVTIKPFGFSRKSFIALHEALGLREIVGIILVTIAAAATARSTSPHE